MSDINQQFVGVRRSAWIQSVAFESVMSPSDILNASDKDVSNRHAFLTKFNYHIGLNNEIVALGDLPLDQFKIGYSALHYLTLAQDKSELQVEKFTKHHCHDGGMGIVVYLMRSGYWVTQTHIDLNNVKEVYKQLSVLNYEPYRPQLIEDSQYGGSPSSSPSPMPTMD